MSEASPLPSSESLVDPIAAPQPEALPAAPVLSPVGESGVVDTSPVAAVASEHVSTENGAPEKSYEFYNDFLQKAQKIEQKGLTDGEIKRETEKKRRSLEKKGHLPEGGQVALTDAEKQLALDRKVYRTARKYVRDNFDDVVEMTTPREGKWTGDGRFWSAVVAVSVENEDRAFREEQAQAKGEAVHIPEIIDVTQDEIDAANGPEPVSNQSVIEHAPVLGRAPEAVWADVETNFEKSLAPVTPDAPHTESQSSTPAAQPSEAVAAFRQAADDLHSATIAGESAAWGQAAQQHQEANPEGAAARALAAWRTPENTDAWVDDPGHEAWRENVKQPRLLKFRQRLAAALLLGSTALGLNFLDGNSGDSALAVGHDGSDPSQSGVAEVLGGGAGGSGNENGHVVTVSTPQGEAALTVDGVPLTSPFGSYVENQPSGGDGVISFADQSLHQAPAAEDEKDATPVAATPVPEAGDEQPGGDTKTEPMTDEAVTEAVKHIGSLGVPMTIAEGKSISAEMAEHLLKDGKTMPTDEFNKVFYSGDQETGQAPLPHTIVAASLPEKLGENISVEDFVTNYEKSQSTDQVEKEQAKTKWLDMLNKVNHGDTFRALTADEAQEWDKTLHDVYEKGGSEGLAKFLNSYLAEKGHTPEGGNVSVDEPPAPSATPEVQATPEPTGDSSQDDEAAITEASKTVIKYVENLGVPMTIAEGKSISAEMAEHLLKDGKTMPSGIDDPTPKPGTFNGIFYSGYVDAEGVKHKPLSGSMIAANLDLMMKNNQFTVEDFANAYEQSKSDDPSVSERVYSDWRADLDKVLPMDTFVALTEKEALEWEKVLSEVYEKGGPEGLSGFLKAYLDVKSGKITLEAPVTTDADQGSSVEGQSQDQEPTSRDLGFLKGPLAALAAAVGVLGVKNRDKIKNKVTGGGGGTP